MAKRMTIMLILATIVFGGAITWYFVKQAMIAKYLSSQKYPPVVVNSTKAKLTDWQDYYDSVGTLTAPQSVNITPEVAGIVTKINFDSGNFVKQGDILVELNADQEKAQLAQDAAKERLAQITYERDQRLYTQQAISSQTLDTDLANLQQARAAVQEDKVLIEQKIIRAPFTGRVGISQVSLGQYISTSPASGTTPIVTIEQVDPLYIDFQIAQQYVSNLKVGQEVEITVDSYPNKIFAGKVDALDVGVDQNSRMIMVEATIPNKDHLLYSGMFVTVHLLMAEHQQIVTVPQTAITYNLYGDLVYVIKDGKAAETFVTVGQRRGDDIEIIKGISAGDEIVTAGQLKLFNGAPVIVSQEAEQKISG